MAMLWPAAQLVVVVAAVALTSRRLCLRLIGDSTGLERLLAQLVLAWVQVVVVAEVCGAAHLAHSWSIGLLHGAVAAAVLVAVRAAGPARGALRPDHRWRRAALLAGLIVASVAGALSLGARSADFDTNRYHIVAVAHWLDTHEMWSLPYAQPGDNTATEPADSELLALTLALPTHDDRLAYTGNVAFGILLVAGIAALAWELGGKESTGLLAGTMLAASPAVFETQTHSLMSDAAAAAGLVAAVALLLGWRRNPENGSRLVLAGLAAGLGAGSKFVALPMAVALVPVALALAPRGCRLRAGVTMAAATLATGGFWYLRNAVATGNPVFPVSFGSRLATNAGAVTRDPVSLLGQLPAHPAAALSWAAILAYSVGPALLLAALAPLALRSGQSRNRRLVTALAGLWLVTALAAPFSGGGAGASMEVMGASLRFALPALALAVAVSAAVVPQRVLGWSLAVAGIGDLYYLVQPQISVRTDLRLDAPRAGVALLLALLVLAVVASRPWVGSAMARLGSRGGRAVVQRRRRAAVAGALPARALVGGAALLLAVPATAAGLRLLPQPTTPAPVAEALARAAQTGRPVVVIDVADVRSLLGATLDGEPVSAGSGSTEGARRQIDDPRVLLRTIVAAHPAAVVLGDDSSVVPAPQLRVPAGWRLVGSVPGGRVYVPDS